MKQAAKFAFVCLASIALFAAPPVEEKFRNDRVSVTEVTLAPGETETVTGTHPSVSVFWKAGSLEATRAGENSERIAVAEGQSVFWPAKGHSIKNTGTSDLRYVRTELLGEGKDDVWGKTGLAPDYKLLIENRYARVYDIRIPAHTKEPQHTHHDRVVICFSGATLKHLYPDGHEEPSTLATGQTAWRGGGTHIGQNLGNTDLWVIAIEPK